ncbi:helix-turn-helix domain-containing protein [Chachezhania sediminis]|uniref:helix-turn-helix domain-containing protein n=1 Tax=Chachezhania sediminis TaxID=2599291 RepID=UPI00131A91A8|nr:helix-turn-helix transcriptional regulator [Chachezhania sediminis]
MDISAHIKDQGLSRAEICEVAGISRAYLSLIEKGERRVGTGKAGALAAALGVPVQSLRPDLAEMFSSPASSNPPAETKTEATP